MSVVRQSLAGRVIGRLRLGVPALFFLFAALTVADLLVPDPIPFVDEIGLALLTALFGAWRRRRVASSPMDAPRP